MYLWPLQGTLCSSHCDCWTWAEPCDLERKKQHKIKDLVSYNVSCFIIAYQFISFNMLYCLDLNVFYCHFEHSNCLFEKDAKSLFFSSSLFLPGINWRKIDVILFSILFHWIPVTFSKLQQYQPCCSMFMSISSVSNFEQTNKQKGYVQSIPYMDELPLPPAVV